MKYPNKINKVYKKEINYSNRGMDLENIINEACKYYLDNDIAVIYKKPTPIGIVEVDYERMVIKKGYFKEPSTLDYNGVYKGKYIEFDAKVTKSTTSFPLSNIHPHQIKHIRNVIRHQGIVFLIIYINNEYYLFKGEDLISFLENNDRKSIPLDVIETLGTKLNYSLKGLEYIKGIDIAYKELI